MKTAGEQRLFRVIPLISSGLLSLLPFLVCVSSAEDRRGNAYVAAGIFLRAKRRVLSYLLSVYPRQRRWHSSSFPSKFHEGATVLIVGRQRRGRPSKTFPRTLPAANLFDDVVIRRSERILSTEEIRPGRRSITFPRGTCRDFFQTEFLPWIPEERAYICCIGEGDKCKRTRRGRADWIIIGGSPATTTVVGCGCRHKAVEKPRAKQLAGPERQWDFLDFLFPLFLEAARKYVSPTTTSIDMAPKYRGGEVDFAVFFFPWIKHVCPPHIFAAANARDKRGQSCYARELRQSLKIVDIMIANLNITITVVALLLLFDCRRVVVVGFRRFVTRSTRGANRRGPFVVCVLIRSFVRGCMCV